MATFVECMRTMFFFKAVSINITSSSSGQIVNTIAAAEARQMA